MRRSDKNGIPQQNDDDLEEYSAGESDVEQADTWTKMISARGISSRD